MKELRGMPVVNTLLEKFSQEVKELSQKNIVPKLAVVRVGAREDDLSYERGIIKRFSAVEAVAEVLELPVDVSQEELERTITSLNDNKEVHGILMFRPLPKHLSEERIKNILLPEKDVDCMCDVSLANVFAGNAAGYPPCTPQAVVEMLDYYGYDLTGVKVTIVGRSLVVGKPLAMLLLAKNATVTICHTRTKDLQAECLNADIIVACAGAAKMIRPEYVREGQTVIDVGINMLDGKLCGDVDYEGAAEKAEAITPVPGGVGTVTTSVLLKHTILSAARSSK